MQILGLHTPGFLYALCLWDCACVHLCVQFSKNMGLRDLTKVSVLVEELDIKLQISRILALCIQLEISFLS